MNSKLSGFIFFIFGISLFFDNGYAWYNDSTSISIKSVLLFLLGISSCIYGYKQIKDGNTKETKDDS